jgi:hypothetical protein
MAEDSVLSPFLGVKLIYQLVGNLDNGTNKIINIISGVVVNHQSYLNTMRAMTATLE